MKAGRIVWSVALVVIVLLVPSLAAGGGPERRELAAREPAAKLSDLRVLPKRICRGEPGAATNVRFRLDRDGAVDLYRLAEAPTEVDRPYIRMFDGPIPADQGFNRIRVPSLELGRRPGRYLLRVITSGNEPVDFGTRSYRLVNC